jgi:hypothetical protein
MQCWSLFCSASTSRQTRQSTEFGNNLTQEFEPLAGDISALVRQPGDVATRSRQARDEAAANRVIQQCENDRDDRCRLLCGVVPNPAVTMTSTLSRTNSAAISANRSLCPSAHQHFCQLAKPSQDRKRGKNL